MCDQSARQAWIKTEKGQFKNSEDPSLCLKNRNGSLKVGSCIEHKNQSRFGFNQFDRTMFLKRQPSLVLTQQQQENTVIKISLSSMSPPNLLQQWTVVPNFGSSIPPPPIVDFMFKSFIPGNYCIEPKDLSKGSHLTADECDLSNNRQKWVFEEPSASFKNVADDDFCLADINGVLKLRLCSEFKSNTFAYDYFDSTLSSTDGKDIITMITSDSVPLEVLLRDLSDYPNGGQEWSLLH